MGMIGGGTRRLLLFAIVLVLTGVAVYVQFADGQGPGQPISDSTRPYPLWMVNAILVAWSVAFLTLVTLILWWKRPEGN